MKVICLNHDENVCGKCFHSVIHEHWELCDIHVLKNCKCTDLFTYQVKEVIESERKNTKATVRE